MPTYHEMWLGKGKQAQRVQFDRTRIDAMIAHAIRLGEPYYLLENRFGVTIDVYANLQDLRQAREALIASEGIEACTKIEVFQIRHALGHKVLIPNFFRHAA